jgi:hypothetical protein
MGEVRPLTQLVHVGNQGFIVSCEICGDVTAQESHGTTAAPIGQVALYRQRHLAKHLLALATEIAQAAR